MKRWDGKTCQGVCELFKELLKGHHIFIHEILIGMLLDILQCNNIMQHPLDSFKKKKKNLSLVSHGFKNIHFI